MSNCNVIFKVYTNKLLLIILEELIVFIRRNEVVLRWLFKTIHSCDLINWSRKINYDIIFRVYAISFKGLFKLWI